MLAFHMHKAQRPDLSRADAIGLIKQWLPTFGLSGSDAEAILESIGTKTGILINEAQHSVVFAQFGLQEYFASLEALPKLGLDAFAKLQPRDWWREVVLLTAAQQREPTALLDKLFSEDALLAAACVAECPTPPIALQKRATDACLKGVDSGAAGAASALVPLLRKLKEPAEGEFCSELEKRLQGDKQRSSIVGIALATAGTEHATAALARHPEVWEACLKNAGYLSSSFEHLLVGWIQDGDESQSGRASELIASRLSGDRFRQMVEILASLRESRAERLAGLLIRHVESRIEERMPGPIYAEEWSLAILARCVPFIRNREKYLAGRSHGWKFNPRQFYDDADATATALFLERKEQRFGAARVQVFLLSCLTWARSRGALLLWFAAGISLLIPLLPPSLRNSSLLVPAGLLVGAAHRPYSILPWMRHFTWRREASLQVVIGVFLCGGWVVLTRGIPVLSFDAPRVAQLSTSLLGLTLMALGLAVNSRDHLVFWPARQSDDLGMKCPKARVSSWVPTVLAGLLLSVVILALATDTSGILAQLSALIGAVSVLWSGFLLVQLASRLRAVKRAHLRAAGQLARSLK
jgi:hypothetical protein